MPYFISIGMESFSRHDNCARSADDRALHPQKLDIGYYLRAGDIVTLKSGYWILSTENVIFTSLVSDAFEVIVSVLSVRVSVCLCFRVSVS